MDSERQSEYARAVWQAQPSQLPLDEIAERAAFLRRSFDATTYIPWIVAAILVACFGLILASSESGVQTAGAIAGLLSALYFLKSAMTLINTPVNDEAPCVRAYARELRRQHDALRLCALTIGMVMTSATVASVPKEVAAWKQLIAPSSSLVTGLGVAWYINGFARRYARRATEVAGLETRSAK
jgi:hypothetical protein